MNHSNCYSYRDREPSANFFHLNDNPPEFGMDSSKRKRGKMRRWEWKKAPGYPKRPLSAYNCFYRDERIRIVEEIPNINDRGGLKGMSSRIANRWRALSKEMKQPYEEEAIREKNKYSASVRLFKASQLDNNDQDEQNEVVASNQTSSTALNSRLTSLAQANSPPSSSVHIPGTQTTNHTLNNSTFHEKFVQLSLPSGVTNIKKRDNSRNYSYPDALINSDYERNLLSEVDKLNSLSYQQTHLGHQTFSANVTQLADFSYNHNDYNSHNFNFPPSRNAPDAIANYSQRSDAPMIQDKHLINMSRCDPTDKLNDQIIRENDSSLQLEYDFSIPFDDQTAPSGYLQSDSIDGSIGGRKREVHGASRHIMIHDVASMQHPLYGRNHQIDEHQLMQRQQLFSYTPVHGDYNSSAVGYPLPDAGSRLYSFDDDSKIPCLNANDYNPKKID